MWSRCIDEHATTCVKRCYAFGILLLEVFCVCGGDLLDLLLETLVRIGGKRWRRKCGHQEAQNVRHSHCVSSSNKFAVTKNAAIKPRAETRQQDMWYLAD